MSTPPLMLYDPATNFATPYPSEANQYREYHPNKAWLYNPYTGEIRTAEDIAADLFGNKLTVNKPAVDEKVELQEEIVEYRGQKFKAVDSANCTGCEFHNPGEGCYFIMGDRPTYMNCDWFKREDRKSVIWIKQV